jgi:hypothetical protein
MHTSIVCRVVSKL